MYSEGLPAADIGDAVHVGAYSVCYSTVFMCVFSFSWERTGFVLFVSCDTLLPRYQFLCFIYFDAIFSLETDIISKQASLQYQSRKSKLSANYQIKSKLSAKT